MYDGSEQPFAYWHEKRIFRPAMGIIDVHVSDDGKKTAGVMSFRIAPMCRMIRAITIVLLTLPVLFAICSLLGASVLVGPAVLVSLIFAWVWLRFRPQLFIVQPDALEVVWPLKRRRIERTNIRQARIIDRRELKNEVGWSMRVGAGGLWGGFGWLWTQHRGIVKMYISRTDKFVWVECVQGRPWLITPEQPESFVQSLSSPQPM